MEFVIGGLWGPLWEVIQCLFIDVSFREGLYFFLSICSRFLKACMVECHGARIWLFYSKKIPGCRRWRVEMAR